MFSGIIYFAEIFPSVIIIEEWKKIYIRENAKLSVSETKIVYGTHSFFGLVVDGRRCVASCIGGKFPDMIGGPSPPYEATIIATIIINGGGGGVSVTIPDGETDEDPDDNIEGGTFP